MTPTGSDEVTGGVVLLLGVTTGWAERVSDCVRQGYPADDQARGMQPGVLVGLSTLPRPGWPADPRVALGLAALVALAVAARPARRSVRSVRSG